MSLATFNARTRNAGNLEDSSENLSRLNASFRSLNKYEVPAAILKNKQNIFDIENDSVKNESLNNMPPKPPSSKSKSGHEKREKKRVKQKDDENKNDEENLDQRRRSSKTRHRSKDRDENSSDAEAKANSHRKEETRSRRNSKHKDEGSDRDGDHIESTESRLRRHSQRENRRHKHKDEKTSDKNDEEEEFIESLKRLTSNRRRRQENDSDDVKTKGEEKSTKNELERRMSKESIQKSHTNLQANNTEENKTKSSKSHKLNEDKEIKHKRTNSIVKLAFGETNTDDNASIAKSDANGSEDEAEVKVEIDKKKSNDLDEAKYEIQIDQDYLEIIKKGSTLDFILTPPKQGQTLSCKFICRKGIFNEYFFYIEKYNGKDDLMIIKAHRRVASTKSYYVIDTINYDNDSQDKNKNCARIISNMARNKFKLDLNDNYFSIHNNNLLNVAFKSRNGEPRKIIADSCLCSGTIPTKDKITYILKNRQPYYDIERKKFVLNYNGRAKKSSKNNFQIVDESSPDNILMQLGKVETSIYNCDFGFPLCALQAFGFALASLCK